MPQLETKMTSFKFLLSDQSRRSHRTRRLTFVLLIGFALFFHSQKADAQLVGCDADIAKLCPAEAGMKERVACLLKRGQDTSASCQQGLQRLSAELKATGSRGGSGTGSSGSVAGGNGLFPPTSPLVNFDSFGAIGPAGRGYTQNKLSVSTPVYGEKKQMLAMSVGAGETHFEGSNQFAGTGQTVPQDLQRYEVGAQYQRFLEGQKFFGMRASVGTASDRPFQNQSLIYSGSIYYSYPGTEKSRWLLSIFYSNNNSLLKDIPIPGFVYLYHDDEFTGMFGLPFAAIQWTPVKPLLLSLSIFGLAINAEAALGLRDTPQAFVGFSWTQDSFILHDRPDDLDRFYIDEKRVFVGARTPLLTSLTAEFKAGYDFDRSLYQKTGFFKSKDGDLDLQDAPFVSLNLNQVF